MWSYDKKLQYPINIKNPNPKLAKFIISQYGGAYCKSLSKAILLCLNFRITNTILIYTVKLIEKQLVKQVAFLDFNL